MKLFDFVPSWLWAAVVAGLLAMFLITNARLSAEQLAHQTTKLTHAEQQNRLQAQLRELGEQYRVTEQKLLADITTTRKETDEKVSAARATAADLRNRLRDIAARPVAGGLMPPPGGLAAFAAPALGGDEAVVLGTLGEADVSEAERAEVIRLDLLACYAAYDAAREAQKD